MRIATRNHSPEVKKRRADSIRRFWNEIDKEKYWTPERRKTRSEGNRKRWKRLSKETKSRVLSNFQEANEQRAANKTVCYHHQGQKRKGSTNRFVGVRHCTENCWSATITYKRKKYYHYAKTEEEAAHLYDEMALQFFGPDATLNFSHASPADSLSNAVTTGK